MKISRGQLRKMIREVMADLEEDAIFARPDVLGLQPEKDIPGQASDPICKKCQMRHPAGSCGDMRQPDGRNLSYGHVKSDDREGRMTRGHLYSIAKYSQSLHDRLNDEDDLPEWVQSKIARAADKLSSAYEYLDYKLDNEKSR